MFLGLSCCSVSCAPFLSTGNISSLFFCPWLLEKIELTSVQNGHLGFGEKNMTYKKKYIILILHQEGLKEQIEKLVKLTPYHQELLQKTPSLGTFCAHSLIQGLNTNKMRYTVFGYCYNQCQIHSFSSLSYDRSKASSKASSPHSAI
jgi:hypothetical protein